MVNKKTKAAAPDGEVETLNYVIKDAEGRVPEPEEAPELTVADVMPQGERDQVDRNPNMPVNFRDNKNLVDFVLVSDCHVI